MPPSESGPGIDIRWATIDEAASIAAVLHEAFVEFEALYTPEAFAATTLTTELIQRRWGEGPVWVAFRSGDVVGTVAAVDRGEALYIRSMGVLPSARGQAIGTRLLEHTEAFARARGCRRMVLSTTPFLLRAIQRYERHGFVRTGEGPVELFGTPLFTMEKAFEP